MVFEAALSAAQCDPSHVVHIGDHPDADIAGAKAMGIATIWINPTGAAFPGAAPPDGEVQTLDELPIALANLSAA